MTNANPAEPNVESPVEASASYESPKLEVIGSIEELTLGSIGTVFDGDGEIP